MSLTDYIQEALEGGQNGVLASRPYLATHGRNANKLVAIVNTGSFDESGNSIYAETVLANNASESALRATDWTNLDTKLVEAAQQQLVLVDDLISTGLTYNAGDIGTLVAEWDAPSELTDAIVTMDGETGGDRDNQDFSRDGVPIPIIHKEFNLGRRALLAARRSGAALDTTHGAAAARAVARTSEKMMFNGYQIQAAGSQSNRHTIRGLLTHPARATLGLKVWDAPATTADEILADIQAMIRKAETEELTIGGYRLYLNTSYQYLFRQDYKAMSEKTLMQRVLEIDGIDAVRFSTQCPVGQVVLVQWLDSTIDLAVISDIDVIQWKSNTGWTDKFQTYAAWAPRIKSDFDGHLGVVHGTFGG